MSYLRQLIEWTEQFASTNEESVLMERAQTELDMLLSAGREEEVA